MENLAETQWDGAATGWSLHIHNRPESALYRKFVLHPMLMQLLGDVNDKTVLDAGCGEGYLSRMLAGMGAKVTGIDLSGKMLDLARERETAANPKNISYEKASLTDLGGMSQTFQVIVSNLVLNIIPVYKEVFAQLSARLDPGGLLIISIAHPCFDGVGEGMIEMQDKEVRWSANRYMDEVSGYSAAGLPTFHRPLSAYINAAFDAGFALTGFLEPVTPKQYSEMFASHIRPYDRLPSLVGLRFKKN